MQKENLEMTSTGLLSLFETNKKQRSIFVADIVEKIENGLSDPLKVHLQIKAMEDIIFQLTSTDEKKNKSIESAKKYKTYLLDAAKKYSSKDFEFLNAKFSIKETGTKYDFSKCGDTDLEELLKQFEELKSKIDAKQSMLKKIPSQGIDMAMEGTGEIVRVYPPSKSSTTSVQVSFTS
jgi:hypothetical protein